MNKILPVVFVLSVTLTLVLAWSEVDAPFSKKNKASQYETNDQVESSDSSDK